MTNLNLNEKQKKQAVIVLAVVFVVAVIAIALITSMFKKSEDELHVEQLVVTKVYDIAPDSPMLMVCFEEAPETGSLSINTFNQFTLLAVTYHEACVDFIINGGDGVGSVGEYAIYLSVEGEDGLKLAEGEVTVKVMDELDEEAAGVQSAALERMGTVGYLTSLIQSDALSDYLADTYITESYAMALRIDEDGELMVLVYLNMPAPSSPDEAARADEIKGEVFEQIRSWGANPDRYNFVFEYSGS